MKSYNLIKKDINQLPLAEIGRQFLALRELSWKKHVVESVEKARAEKNEAPDAARLMRDFRTLGSAERLELELILNRFADSFQITRNASWFFPQCLAKLASIKLPRNEKGLVSAKELVKEHYSKDTFIMGIYTIFMFAKRGTILKNQTSEASRNFSKLVPLIMSAYKQYGNVGYEEWEPEEIRLVVDEDLYHAMNLEEYDNSYMTALQYGLVVDPRDHTLPEDMWEGKGFDTATILGWRNDALTIKTGEKRGVIRNPVSTYSMSPSEDNPMKDLDPLNRHMFLQTWCAHPDNRTPLMVLDPFCWDFMPEPLIDIKYLHTSLEDEAKNLFNAFEEAKIDVGSPW